MKDFAVPMNEILPISDDFIMELLTADTVNGCILHHIEEADGKGHSVSMWPDYYKTYGSKIHGRPTKSIEKVYRGIILRTCGDDSIEAVLLLKVN